MQVLTEKNTVLSQELEKCKVQLEAALAAAGEPKETPSGKIHFERLVLCGVGANLTMLQMAPDSIRKSNNSYAG